MNGRIAVIIGAVVAVIAAAIFALGGKSSSPSSTSDTTKAPKGSLELTLAYSPEKEVLLKDAIKAFNAEGKTVGDKKIFVTGENRSSGEAQILIAKGKYKPTMWSPSSSFWGRLLNYDADAPLVADENPSIVNNPLVIAMWEQLADAYGYPKKPLGFAELTKLATGGWATVGKPEFGTFKYVHTNPDFSTSGLSAVSASYYAAVGKKEGLTVADVDKGKAQVQKLEESIVHYGDTTLFIANEMKKRGIGYASAVAMEEQTLIDYNVNAGSGPKLVAVYPKEGTFVSDNPLITLNGSWVSDEQKEGSAEFAKFLSDYIDADKAGKYGFRPGNMDEKPTGLVVKENGVDPSQPKRVLRLPEPKVLVKIKDAWRADRKPANVMVVFDTSGSMGEENKLAEAQNGLTAFFNAAAPQDRIGLTKFSAEITQLVPIEEVKTNRSRLLSATKALLPEEDTAVRDATLHGVRSVESRLNKKAINAVVVLTDGEDTASSASVQNVVDELSKQSEKESGQIRVFTIAYGSEPNEGELAKYAEASGGKAFVANKTNIEQVYLSISSFF